MFAFGLHFSLQLTINRMLSLFNTLIGAPSSPFSWWNIPYFATDLQFSSQWFFLCLAIVAFCVRYAPNQILINTILVYTTVSSYILSGTPQLSIAHLGWIHELTAISPFWGSAVKLASFAHIASVYLFMIVFVVQFCEWLFALVTNMLLVLRKTHFRERPSVLWNYISSEWQRILHGHICLPSASNRIRIYLRSLENGIRTTSAFLKYSQAPNTAARFAYFVTDMTPWLRFIVSAYALSWASAFVFSIITFIAYKAIGWLVSSTQNGRTSTSMWRDWFFEILWWLSVVLWFIIIRCLSILDDTFSGLLTASKNFFWALFFVWPLLLWEYLLHLWVAFLRTAKGLGNGPERTPIDLNEVSNSLEVAHWILLLVIIISILVLLLCCCCCLCEEPDAANANRAAVGPRGTCAERIEID
jgi:hypothetical protein